MDIFISHAVADEAIALPFQTLLLNGTGLKKNDVFCSSRFGDVKNGEFFVQKILTKLVEAKLTVSLLSPNYFASQFCVTELGTAIARQFDKNAEFCSFVIPPLGFTDLKGMMTGMHSAHVWQAKALDSLRDYLPGNLLIGKWEPARIAFQAAIDPVIKRRKAQALIKGLTVLDVYHDPAKESKPKFKNKLRVLIQNNTGVELVAKKARWNHGRDGIAMQHPPHGDETLQLEGDGGWARDSWLPEKAKITVGSGVVFRLWIGLNQSYSAPDIRRRQIAQKLGKVALSIEINGTEVQWHRQL